MQRRELFVTAGKFAATTAIGLIGASATAATAAAAIGHGFHATINGKPGKGEALIELLLRSPALTNDDCLVFLVGRSASKKDVVFVTEGWKTKEVHERFFASEVAKRYVAEFAPLVDGESVYLDEVPLGGKAVLG